RAPDHGQRQADRGVQGRPEADHGGRPLALPGCAQVHRRLQEGAAERVRDPVRGRGSQGRFDQEIAALGRLIGRRLLFLLPVLFGILVAVFVTLRIVPGDPARLVAGPDAGPEELAAIRQQFGLDQPLHIQFARYLRAILRGEFGRSLKTQRPGLDGIERRLGDAGSLAGAGTPVAVLAALPACMVAAARRNSSLEQGPMVVAMMGVSTPSFYLAIVLIVVFGVMLRPLPAGGSGG